MTSGRNVLEVTSATWNERTSPSRSTSEKTACFFGRRAEDVLRLAADIGFVRLDNLVRATDRAGRGVDGALAKAMKQEPRGLVVGADHPYELKGANALLGRSHELSGQHPLAEWDVGALHDGADGDGEGLAAVLALVDAGARALAL